MLGRAIEPTAAPRSGSRGQPPAPQISSEKESLVSKITLIGAEATSSPGIDQDV
jgi:hypothetical protein